MDPDKVRSVERRLEITACAEMVKWATHYVPVTPTVQGRKEMGKNLEEQACQERC